MHLCLDAIRSQTPTLCTMSRLKLTRPIVYFDLEATGTNPQTDRIVELAAAVVWLGGGGSRRLGAAIRKTQ